MKTFTSVEFWQGVGSGLVKGIGTGLLTAGVVGLGLAFAPAAITGSAVFGTAMGALTWK